MPLPEDRGRRGDARPKVHRFRSYDLELGQRLRTFRERHGLTQADVAPVLDAGTPTTVTQWESGARVPEGGRRWRVEALVAGRLWAELRAAVVAAPGMPARWGAAVRWYRRASRERARRAAEGAAIAALLGDLRDTHRPDVLRGRYSSAGAGWAHGAAASADAAFAGLTPGALRLVEDAAFGLRWLENPAGAREGVRTPPGGHGRVTRRAPGA